VREPGKKNGLSLYAPLNRAPIIDIIGISKPTVLAIRVDRTSFRADLVLTAMRSRPKEDSKEDELPSRQLWTMPT